MDRITARRHAAALAAVLGCLALALVLYTTWPVARCWPTTLTTATPCRPKTGWPGA